MWVASRSASCARSDGDALTRRSTQEYIFIFTFVEEDGRTKIAHIKEFLDSAYTQAFLSKVTS